MRFHAGLVSDRRLFMETLRRIIDEPLNTLAEERHGLGCATAIYVSARTGTVPLYSGKFGRHAWERR